jgi:hypothetical protein
MKIVLRTLGTLLAVGAAIISVVALDHGKVAGGMEPMGAVGMAAAAFVLLKASEHWT